MKPSSKPQTGLDEETYAIAAASDFWIGEGLENERDEEKRQGDN